MMREAPFLIGQNGTSVTGAPAPWRSQFDQDFALRISGAFAPDYLAKLVERAAGARFIEDQVEGIGSRAIEAPQRIGAAISLMLHNQQLLRWIEQATGVGPVRAFAGRLAETRANGNDALAWHDDREDLTRLLAVVINLSDRPFSGGHFELRRKQAQHPHLIFDHDQPGSMLIFAVRPELEHRVTPLLAGGPRRVFAGWYLSRPEHDHGTLVSAKSTG
jgi:2OG-Fe(II) oxygenase superfamily